MAITVGNDVDSYECLQRKVEETEQNSYCTFVIESSKTVENAKPYRGVVCFDFETKNM